MTKFMGRVSTTTLSLIESNLDDGNPYSVSKEKMEKIDYQLLSSLFLFSQQSEILDEFDLSSLCYSETKIRNINHTFQVSQSLSASRQLI